jgi:hypothetical protein
MPLFRRPGGKTYITDNSKTYQSTTINAVAIPQVIAPLNGDESMLVIQNDIFKRYPLSAISGGGGGVAPVPYLYDIAPYISAGVSLRQLQADWVDSFIDVYRHDGSGAWQGYGFSDGALDLSTISAFAAGSDVSVGSLGEQIRYWESGGVWQNELSQQPYLVYDGNIVIIGGKPCLYFPGGANRYFLSGLNIDFNQSFTAICVMAIAGATSGGFMKFGLVDSPNGMSLTLTNGTHNTIGKKILASKLWVGENPSTSDLTPNTPAIIEFNYNGNGVISLYLNGSFVGQSNGQLPRAEEERMYAIGGYDIVYPDGFFSFSYFAEFFFFENVMVDRVITSQERADITNNMKAYYGIA